MPRAFNLGYAGVSHKNCKGVIKGLANAALVARRGGLLSAEDLANVVLIGLLGYGLGAGFGLRDLLVPREQGPCDLARRPRYGRGDKFGLS